MTTGYHDLLSPDREYALLIRAGAGDKDAASVLIEHNQRLVWNVAIRYHKAGIAGYQEIEDLVQWGNMGLMDAIRKYDPKRRTRFSTYAILWIRAYIYRYTSINSGCVRLPHKAARKILNIRHARAVLSESLRREPTAQEIAAHLSLPVDFVAGALASFLAGSVSLDQVSEKSPDIDNPSLLSEIVAGDQVPVLDQVERQEVLRSLHDAIAALPERTRQMVEMRLEGHTWQQIADCHGSSATNARVVTHRALACLRAVVDQD